MIFRFVLRIFSVILLVSSGVSTAAAAEEVKATDAKVLKVEPVFDGKWISYIAIGAQFLPDYDETSGRNTGLNKQQMFGQLTVDGRFGSADKFSLKSPFSTPFHTGVQVSLLGTAVKRPDKPSVSPSDFNDVAHTLVASGYLYMPVFHHSPDWEHNLGPIFRAGAISRESISSSGDSVNGFYSVGVQYSSERFMKAKRASDNASALNGVPEGYIRLAATKFDNYAGLGSKTRFVAEAALRIYSEQNMYFGVQGNFGKGPDEFMLVISLVRQPKEIASLISLGKSPPGENKQ